MASPLYDDFAAAAVELLEEFGQNLVVSRASGGGDYDPETGGVTPGVNEVYLGTGAEFDYRQDLIDGTVVLQGDRRVLIAPDLATTPRPGDTVALEDGTTLTVVASKPVKPAGPIVLHEVQARGV